MTPFEMMAAKYAEYPQEASFDWYVHWYMEVGFVFCTPEFFVMGRHVRRMAQDSEIGDPTHLFSKEESDCWYVHAMAGDMAKAWSVMPWELPWMAFERIRDGKRELQFVTTERLRSMCQSVTHPHPCGVLTG